jgi:hypothetical protein
MYISNDGLVLIIINYNTIEIEYLYNNNNYSYKIENDTEHIINYEFNIMGEIKISPSTKYFIKYMDSEPCLNVSKEDANNNSTVFNI